MTQEDDADVDWWLMIFCCGNYCYIKFRVFDQTYDFGAIKKES